MGGGQALILKGLAEVLQPALQHRAARSGCELKLQPCQERALGHRQQAQLEGRSLQLPQGDRSEAVGLRERLAQHRAGQQTTQQQIQPTAAQLQQLITGQGSRRGHRQAGWRSTEGAFTAIGLPLPEQRAPLAAEHNATLLQVLGEAGQRAQHLAHGTAIPVHGLTLPQVLGAAQGQAPRRPAAGPQLLLQKLACQRIGRHHHQIIQPQAVGGEWQRGWRAQHQIGPGITMGAPELPPQATLSAPEATGSGGAQALHPQGWRRLGRLGRKALQQGRSRHQTLKAGGGAPGEAEQQQRRHQQQRRRGEQGERQGQPQAHGRASP